MRSKRLSRQLKKTLGEAFDESSVEGLPPLLDSIDETYHQLEEKAEFAQRNLELSSQELTVANKDLFQLNQTFDAMVNSLGQGFLLFGRDGVCLNTYSRACERLLESAPAGRHVADVLKVPAERRNSFDGWLKILFEERLDFQDAARLGQRNFEHSADLVVSLDYKAVRDREGTIIYAVLIATDRTQEVKAKKLAEEMQSYARMVVSILKDKNRFRRFVQDARGMLDSLRELTAVPVPGTEEIKLTERHLHTLKGAAGSFGLSQLGESIHQAETELARRHRPADKREALERLLPEIEQIFRTTLEKNREIIGDDCLGAPPKREFSVEFLKGFAVLLQSMEGPDQIYDAFVSQFVAVPMRELIGSFEFTLRQTAERLGKTVEPVQFVGEDVGVIPEEYEGMLATLPHVFRNIADHGIEAPATRRAVGKSPAGAVQIEISTLIERSREMIEIAIRDDGAGIDVERIRTKLASSGQGEWARTASRGELLDKIFESGFSTAGKITEISGRGVGLDAVRAAVEEMGGSIRVETDPGKGTCFFIRVPAVRKLHFGNESPGLPKSA